MVWLEPHHLALPGSISIRPGILSKLLYDVIESLAMHGFAKFLVIKGHRIANLPWLQIAGEQTQRDLEITFKLFDPAYMSKEIVEKLEFSSFDHADEIETSHLLFIRPDLVDIAEAKDYLPEESLLYHVDPHDSRDTLCYVPTQKKQT